MSSLTSHLPARHVRATSDPTHLRYASEDAPLLGKASSLHFGHSAHKLHCTGRQIGDKHQLPAKRLDIPSDGVDRHDGKISVFHTGDPVLGSPSFESLYRLDAAAALSAVRQWCRELDSIPFLLGLSCQ